MPTAELPSDLLPLLEHLLPWVVAVLTLVGLIIVALIFALDLLYRRRLRRQRVVFLELTPPANADKTPEATKHLFRCRMD